VSSLRQNLFVKRIEVYFSLRLFLTRFSELGDKFDAAQVLQETKQAKFLFPPEIEEFLLDVCHRARKFQSLKEQAQRAQDRDEGPLPIQLSDERDAASLWLTLEAPKLAERKFEAHLRLKSY
jgi:hypothetical protein